MTMIRLTMAQAVVRYLGRQHTVQDGERRRSIPAMLGIFGHGNVAGLGQALDELQAEMPYVQGRNEQSLVHVAAAFAKASRRRSALAVTASIGPGATNMITGAALATVNRLPVLLLPGDTYAGRRQGPVLQQLEHPLAGDISVNDCFRPVARFFDRITRPEQLLTALPEAMRVLTSPAEMGSVVLALPQDVQAEAADFPATFFAERDWTIARPGPEEERVAEVARMLAAAERPLIVAGGGVLYSDAAKQLAAVATAFGIPVCETFAGKGAVETEAWWAMGGIGVEGNPGANALAAGADLVLHVGTRLTDFTTASQSIFAAPGVRFASINITDHDARKQGAVAIVADARRGLAALLEAGVRAGVRPRPEWEARARAAMADWLPARAAALAGPTKPAAPDTPMTQGQLIGLLQELARPGDTIVAAAGAPPGDLLKAWDATGGRACHLEFGFSCMGYEIPATLGVRLAQPDGAVIALIGDGTFLMQPTELVTALQEHLAVTVVVAENHGFQVIRRLQLLRNGAGFGNELRERSGRLGEAALDGATLQLDLVALARGLGADATRASTPDEVRAAILATRDRAGPSVIVVETDPDVNLPGSGVWWDVASAEVSDRAAVVASRAAYEDGLSAQRWHG
ncbi:MAG: 3D-(3,5/4)-trihydroxycyclohexane-1,2-dione acylhydrolase (decyclizing) [Chloroflexi bacterium]|nr:3D-(3,5/4)-trihydroxycyclohexane-1,2-dione acylhydrolase (decyclizing) [Chloroflexota bacterium]